MALADIESLVKHSTGLDPASIGTSAVERAVRQRQRACRVPQIDAYWELVRDSAPELQALIESVVVAETWFFRDEGAFAALAKTVRDTWLPSKPAGVLRLLSLPCATGEEPYSMAITLLEAGLPADRFRVDAVDISERVLEHGRHGAYGASAFRGHIAPERTRHLARTVEGWRVTDAVRRQVHFHQGNILSPGLLPGAEPYDAIFSRNLLIYFDRPTQDRAIDVLSALLAPHGLLFAGPAETVAFINRGFIPERTPKAFAFRKAGETTQPAVPVMPPTPLRVVSRLTADQDDARAVGRRAPTSPSTGLAAQATARAAALEEGTRLANRGRLEDAVRCCQDSVERDGPSADLFYLLGLIRDASGDALEAMSGYQKALYLDPHHENALVHLALLLDALGRKPEAERFRVRARRAAMRSGT